MTRYSTTKRDEAPEKDSDLARRRTKPADVGPPSVKRVEALYGERKRPYGDDLGVNAEHQKPQFEEDKHDEKKGRYTNDVPEGSYLRGGGAESIYDGKNTRYTNANVGAVEQKKAEKRAKAAEAINGGYKQPSGKFTGTGQDMKASPFSAAHRKGLGEGF